MNSDTMTTMAVLNSSSIVLPTFTDATTFTYSKSDDHFSRAPEIESMINAFLAISGIMSNTCVIWTFIQMGLDEGINICYLGLAIADLTFDFTMVIHAIAYYCHAIELRYPNVWYETVDPHLIVYFIGAIGNMVFMMPALITAYIAIAKIVGVILPFKFKQIFTRRTFFINVAIFSVVALASNLPILVHMGWKYETNREWNATRRTVSDPKSRKRVKTIVRFFTYFLLSLVIEIIIVASVVIMVWQIRKSKRFRGHLSPQEDVSVKNKYSPRLTRTETLMILQVVTISLIFLICAIPRMVQSLMLFIDYELDYGGDRENLYKHMNNVRILFEIINCSANCYVYLIFNSRFRYVWFPETSYNYTFPDTRAIYMRQAAIRASQRVRGGDQHAWHRTSLANLAASPSIPDTGGVYIGIDVKSQDNIHPWLKEAKPYRRENDNVKSTYL